MNKITLVLTALLLLAMVIVMAPNVIAMSRGKTLRNIALWLAIFLGLAIVYRTAGPGSPHPLFSLPQAMQAMHPAQNPAAGSANPGGQGYTPPKE
jgi:hypothetical protein